MNLKAFISLQKTKYFTASLFSKSAAFLIVITLPVVLTGCSGFVKSLTGNFSGFFM